MAQGAPRGRGYVERANVITNAVLTLLGLTPFSKEFPMGEGWWTLFLRFTINLTIGTGTTAVTEGELLIIKNVLLKSDRGEIICNLPGRALYKIATYRSGEAPRKDAIAASTGTYRVTLPIYFADPSMLRPEDSILDTSRYNSVSLQVTYGSVADLLGTPGTATITANLDVEIERSLGTLPAQAKPICVASYDYRQPIDANVLQLVDLERSSDLSIKRLYVHSCTGGQAGQPWSGANADTIQNVIILKDQNRYIEKERIHAMIQDVNKHDAKLESTIVGVEVFDYVSKDQSITAALATAGKSLLQYVWTNQGGVGAGSLITVTAEGIRSLK